MNAARWFMRFGGKRSAALRSGSAGGAFVLAGLACTMGPLAGTLFAQTPAVKYRLEPGQQVTYTYRTDTRPLSDPGPATERNLVLHIWCLGTASGSIRVLVEGTAPGHEHTARGLVIEIDPTGRRRLTDEAVRRLPEDERLLDVLPALPLGVQLLPEWATPPDPLGRMWRCRWSGPPGGGAGDPQADAASIAFVVEDLPAVRATWGIARQGSFTLDRQRGLVTRFESEETNARLQQRTRVTAGLQEVRTHPATWISRRAAEAARYEQMLTAEDRLYGEVGLRPGEVEQILAQLDRLWAGFRTEIEDRSGSPFAGLVDARRQQLRQEAEKVRARAALGVRWLNQPARGWTLQDSAGQTVTSESVRRGPVTNESGRGGPVTNESGHGGPVMEVFWSTQSLAGVRVLATVPRLRDQPPPHSWPVICYNLDPHLPDAVQAIQAIAASPAIAARPAVAASPAVAAGPAPEDVHLLAGPLADLENIPEVPVIRVVDAKGIVRGVWFGWQPDYPAARAMTIEFLKEGSRR